MGSENWFEKYYIPSRLLGLFINWIGYLLTDKGLDFVAGLIMLVGFLMILGFIKFNFSDKGVKNTKIFNENVNPVKGNKPNNENTFSTKSYNQTMGTFQYQSASNIHLISKGGYVLNSNSNYYNLLLFETGGTCKKATIHKSQEINPGGVIFLTVLNSCMNIPGNKGFWNYTTEKNELLIKFNLDKAHEQTFRCKLRSDGTLVVNVFYTDEDTGEIKKEIREYYFDPHFKSKFIL